VNRAFPLAPNDATTNKDVVARRVWIPTHAAAKNILAALDPEFLSFLSSPSISTY
jgi:hypothetical protein